MTKDEWKNYHAMVLASLVGEGDPDFARMSKVSVDPSHVVFAGIDDQGETEKAVYQKHAFKNVLTADFEMSSDKVIDLLRKTGASKVAVHFDLDVLDTNEFKGQGAARPDIFGEHYKKTYPGASIASVVRLIQDTAKAFDLVGLGITEHFPADAIILADMLKELPLIGGS